MAEDGRLTMAKKSDQKDLRHYLRRLGLKETRMGLEGFMIETRGF
jgi:hypothetical protein